MSERKCKTCDNMLPGWYEYRYCSPCRKAFGVRKRSEESVKA